ncbi:MAG: S8 family serine peptidase [Ignavibacteriaceae bacterium]|nr:S8 family serine peptidase [Ignavibacteriaceae bacterium]
MLKHLVAQLVLIVMFLPGMLLSQAVTQNVMKSGDDILYLSNEIIVKLRQEPVTDMFGNLSINEKIMERLIGTGVVEAKKLYPHKTAEASNGLNRIVSIKYKNEVDPLYLSSKMKNDLSVEWAEPRYIYKIDLVPNDPSIGSQYYLNTVKAYEAWDLSTGSSSVIIGIVDTGIDWNHPDLSDNIWQNTDEISGNNIDDDGNGYVDDYIGWDFGGFTGTPDNDPMEDQPDHGTHVAGCASAVTNNGIGVASLGYKAKLMAIKTSINNQRDPSSGQPYIVYGYEGIVYGADNGAHIINCSWGGGGYSLYGQEIINYALTKGTVVVAAAGNSSSINPHYPSGFNHVLAVASTNSSDSRSSFSNYGYKIEVAAPGSSIYNTWMDNTYATLSGTSMASPVAAGLVALVMARFPNYTPYQAAQHVRVTTDNINANNPSFQDLLGTGRINAKKAMETANAVSARLTSYSFSDQGTGDGDGIFEPGEVIHLRIDGINYLNATSALTAELVSKTNYATVTGNAVYNAGVVQPNGTFNNASGEFMVTLGQSIPENAQLNFQVRFSDGSYSDFQWVNTIGNPTYATQACNDVALTITSRGNLGFDDYPNNTKGSGFKYNGGNNMLFEGALMIATTPVRISNSARNSSGNNADKDFQTEVPFLLEIPGVKADVEGFTRFNDNLAGGSAVGTKTELRSYSYGTTGDENYIIVRYTIKNTSGTNLTNLYAGLFFDWDLIDGSGDLVSYNSSANYGKMSNSSASFSTKTAVALISGTNYGFYAINNDGTGGSFSIYDGYSDSEKWTSLSSGLTGRLSGGPADISCVVSAGPYSINQDDSIDIAFVIAASDNDQGLTSAVENARNKWNAITSVKETGGDLPVSFRLEQNYPNPFNPETVIRYSVPENGPVSLRIFDITGKEIRTLVDMDQNAGNYEARFDALNLSSGVYFYELRAAGNLKRMKMLLLK